MFEVFCLFIGLVLGYGIGKFIEARKNAMEKRQLMLELGNTIDNAKDRARKRWNM
jgi:hypothetical protein